MTIQKVRIQPSAKKTKKLEIVVEYLVDNDKPKVDGDMKYKDKKLKKKTLNIGSAAHQDFTSFPEQVRDKKKALYIKRHEGKENWDTGSLDALLSNGLWSRYLLWGDNADIKQNVQELKNKLGVPILYAE